MKRSMKLLALGVAVQLLADVVVGLRLLVLARRTRELPELALGIACVGLGGVGLPLALAVRAGLVGADAPGLWLAAALGVQNLACLALWIATWRVFRADSPAARAVVAVAGAALVLSIPGSAADAGVAYWIGWAARGGAFVWSTAEAAHYAHLLRLRVPLGLADPVVADRIRLWAISCAMVSVGFAVFFACRVQGLNPAETPAVLAVTSAIGLAAGATLWLAFVPTRWYRARIAARAERAST